MHKGYAHADFESAHQLSAVTLNVNGGCLGTNTGFSRAEAGSESDSKERKGAQRIVVGTWLLAKESSLCLAAAVRTPEEVSAAGDRVLDCLTTLKHQGAAYAAMGALQSLSSRAYSLRVPSSPNTWSAR